MQRSSCFCCYGSVTASLQQINVNYYVVNLLTAMFVAAASH